MIINLDPYELFLMGAAVSGYLIREELRDRKYIKILRSIILAVGLKPETFDL